MTDQTVVYIDSHAHLDDEQFLPDCQAVITRAIESDICCIINPGTDLESSLKAIKMAQANPIVQAAVGFHPHEAHKARPADYYQLAEWVEQDKIVAIGEIGLDYYYDYSPRDVQQQVLIQQLDLARQIHLPVIIHNRDAHQDIMKIIKTEGQGLTGVIHCYSGSWEMAVELLRMNFMLSFGGPITFKNAVKVAAIVEKMPLDRLLIETDSPYLAPHPRRGKRNEPANVLLVAAEVARLKNITIAEVAAKTTKNTQELFGL